MYAAIGWARTHALMVPDTVELRATGALLARPSRVESVLPNSAVEASFIDRPSPTRCTPVRCGQHRRGEGDTSSPIGGQRRGIDRGIDARPRVSKQAPADGRRA